MPRALLACCCTSPFFFFFKLQAVLLGRKPLHVIIYYVCISIYVYIYIHRKVIDACNQRPLELYVGLRGFHKTEQHMTEVQHDHDGAQKHIHAHVRQISNASFDSRAQRASSRTLPAIRASLSCKLSVHHVYPCGKHHTGPHWETDQHVLRRMRCAGDMQAQGVVVHVCPLAYGRAFARNALTWHGVRIRFKRTRPSIVV